MKIAFLTPEYPHPKTGSSGGIGTSIKNLAKGLLLQNCIVHVLVYGQNEESVFEDNGVVIHQIKNIRFKGLSWYLTRKKIQNYINQLVENKEIDIVEAPDWTGITSFIKTKCPMVIKLHGSDTYFCHLEQRSVKWINKFHEKSAINNADGCISVSQFTANVTNDVFGLNKKFNVIPNGIDAITFTNDGNIPEKDTILYFGSIIRKKGLLELPLIFNEIIQKNPNSKLILIGKDVPDISTGNTSTWAMMQELFTDDALKNVTYLGSIPHQEIQYYIQQAAICVFPSFAEAFPISWLEAMTMEKSIVASNIGWAKEVIDDAENGFLVHPKNHQEFAEKIVELFENAAVQKEFGKNARNKVLEKFSQESVASQNLEYYKSIIGLKN